MLVVSHSSYPHQLRLFACPSFSDAQDPLRVQYVKLRYFAPGAGVRAVVVYVEVRVANLNMECQIKLYVYSRAFTRTFLAIL